MDYIDINGKSIIRLIFKFYCLFVCDVEFSWSGFREISRPVKNGEDFRVS
jgi:hypothetical protein